MKICAGLIILLFKKKQQSNLKNRRKEIFSSEFAQNLLEKLPRVLTGLEFSYNKKHCESYPVSFGRNSTADRK